MKKILPLLIIFAVVLSFFKPVFFNKLLPIPSDTIVGLYYPFRDLYASTNPNGLPFHNFLITDPVRQQYPWRYLSIELEKKLHLPLWNPYSFAGTPLLANFQSAAFYPLNIVLFLLPFPIAWTTLIILEPLLGGIFLYLFLKNLKLHTVASLLGAIAFAFSGFFTAWMEWNTVLQVAIWLPLLLLSIDKVLFHYKTRMISHFKFHISNTIPKFEKYKIWLIICIFSLTASFLGGHLQTFFYLCLISLIYFIARFLQHGLSPKVFFLFSLVIACFFVLTAMQWIPTLHFIELSARNIDQNWHQDGWFIPWQNLIQFVVPDFFGNPATANYWGVWNYAEFLGYIGIVPLLFALFAMFFRHDRKTLFFGTLFFLSLLFALPTIFAKLPFLFSIPFLSTAQPTRLLFITDFSLAILGALGLDYFFKTKSKTIFYPLGFLLVVFIGIWVVVLLNSKLLLITPENITVTKHNLYLPTALFFIATICLISSFLVTKFFISKNDKKKIKNAGLFITCSLLLLTIFDLFRFVNKFETFASQTYLYPDTSVIQYLQQHAGIYRVMTTDDRILPPNFSSMYHIQTIDGYDPLYLLRYGEFIAASERGKPDISPPFGFNRILTPKNYDSSLINLLGVKYVLSLSDIKSPKLQKVFQDAQTRVYENTQVLPRVFFVSYIKGVNTRQQAITTLFDQAFDIRKQAVLELGINLSLVGTGTANITNYSENTVTIDTNTNADSFLVFTDIDYPTWHVSIDGKERMLYTTDYLFRGVVVPAGKHKVIFYDMLF